MQILLLLLSAKQVLFIAVCLCVGLFVRTESYWSEIDATVCFTSLWTTN